MYGIEFEKNLFDGVFLGKKNYILYGQNLTSGEMIFTTRGLFKANYATPCKTFLANLLQILFGKILRLNQGETTLDEIDRALDAMFEEFLNTSEENFYNRQIMGTDLHSIKNKTMLHHQLLEIEARDSSKTYGSNFELISRHYDFCFWRNVPGVYGPLDASNRAQAAFVQKFPLSTALVEDNIEWYKKNCPEFTPEYQKISRRRMLMNDLGSPLQKLFRAFDKSNIDQYDLFFNLFSMAYKRNFNVAYQFNPSAVKPKKGSVEAIQAAAQRALAKKCNRAGDQKSLVSYGYVQTSLDCFRKLLTNKK